MPIKKNIPVPLYFQLHETLHDKLDNGVWKPGDRLPTEEEFCKEYSVSRTTVRNALRLLKMEGIIEQSRGRGTIVARPKVHEYILQSVIGSYALVYPQGGRLTTKVLETAVVIPPKPIKSALKLDEGQEATIIARIRIVDNEPLFWTTAYVPYDICPDFVKDDFENRSFFDLLENKYGIYVACATRTITSVLSTYRTVNYLGVEHGSPLSKVVVISYIEDGTPVEYSESFFRGDRVRFDMTVKRKINEHKDEGLIVIKDELAENTS